MGIRLVRVLPRKWIAFLLAGLWVGCSGHRAPEPKITGASMRPTTAGKPQPADNAYCYVCHVNFQDESLAHSHQVAGVGCEQCHGMSAKHSADEDNLTAPEIMYSAARINPFCLKCHPQDKIGKVAMHAALFTANATPPSRCTECHGEHRLKNRTRRWDKESGKLIWKDSGPVMDR